MTKASDKKVKAILKKIEKGGQPSAAEDKVLIEVGIFQLYARRALFRELREKASNKKETVENRTIFHNVLLYSLERGERRKLKNQEIKAGRKEWAALKRKVARKKAK